MAVSASAEAVFFVIQSALKLGAQARQAMVESALSRALTLPLPDYTPADDCQAAYNHFGGLVAVAADLPPGLVALVDKYDSYLPQGGLDREEQKKLLDYHDEYRLQEIYASDTAATEIAGILDSEAFNAVVTVRQWRRGSEPHPTALQRVAGSLVEIAVDYYATGPGHINASTREGKALKAILAGIDDIEFADVPLQELPEKLLVATLETVERNPGLITDDGNVQELIRVTGAGLGRDVQAHIRTSGAMGRAGNVLLVDRVESWAELVFRSVLSTAGKTVAADPERFLNVTGAGRKALVSDVGGTLLDFLLAQDDIQIDSVFSAEGLDAVTRAALGVLSHHPDLIVNSEREGLKALLRDIASDISARDKVLSRDMAPEFIRVVLEKTAKNLPLVWPGELKTPEANLALVAARKTLEILSTRADSGWNPTFGKDELLQVTESVVDEIVANPAWLIAIGDDVDANLGAVLRAVTDVLRRRADDRLSAETGAKIVQAAIRAVALRQPFLERIGDDERLIVACVIDDLLAVAFATDPADDVGNQRIEWQLLRPDNLVGVIEIVLEELVEVELTETTVDTLKDFGVGQATAIAEGKPWSIDLYRRDLRKALGKDLNAARD